MVFSLIYCTLYGWQLALIANRIQLSLHLIRFIYQMLLEFSHQVFFAILFPQEAMSPTTGWHSIDVRVTKHFFFTIYITTMYGNQQELVRFQMMGLLLSVLYGSPLLPDLLSNPRSCRKGEPIHFIHLINVHSFPFDFSYTPSCSLSYVMALTRQAYISLLLSRLCSIKGFA